MTELPQFDVAALDTLARGCSDATAIFLADQLGTNTFVIRTIDDKGSEGALVDREALTLYLKKLSG